LLRSAETEVDEVKTESIILYQYILGIFLPKINKNQTTWQSWQSYSQQQMRLIFPDSQNTVPRYLFVAETDNIILN